MLNAICAISINQLVKFFRFNQVPERRIPYIVRNTLLFFYYVLNGMIAAFLGYTTMFYFVGDSFAATKVAFCMVTVGFHLRVIPSRGCASVFVSRFEPHE